MLDYTIPLEARTKKNSMMIAGNGTRCWVCGKPARQWIRQSKAHDAFAAKAIWFLRPTPAKPIDFPVNVRCTFYMATHRMVDLLNLEACIHDLLVEAKVLADDNCNIVFSTDGSKVAFDKARPRVEISITALQDAGDER